MSCPERVATSTPSPGDRPVELVGTVDRVDSGQPRGHAGDPHQRLGIRLAVADRAADLTDRAVLGRGPAHHLGFQELPALGRRGVGLQHLRRGEQLDDRRTVPAFTGLIDSTDTSFGFHNADNENPAFMGTAGDRCGNGASRIPLGVTVVESHADHRFGGSLPGMECGGPDLHRVRRAQQRRRPGPASAVISRACTEIRWSSTRNGVPVEQNVFQGYPYDPARGGHRRHRPTPRAHSLMDRQERRSPMPDYLVEYTGGLSSANIKETVVFLVFI
jgi:hypothetical protein